MIINLPRRAGVCFLRLDFESFTLLGTGNMVETTLTGGATVAAGGVPGVPDGGTCMDTFDVTVRTIATTTSFIFNACPEAYFSAAVSVPGSSISNLRG